MFPQEDLSLLIDVLRGRSNDYFGAARAALNVLQWAKSQFGPPLVGAAPEVSDGSIIAALEGLHPVSDNGTVQAIPPWLIPILIQLVKRYLDRLS